MTAGPSVAAAKLAVVGTDPVGDWGTNIDPTLAPVGDALGQDLTKASIGLKDAKTLNFVIGVNSLPPNGGVPEISRYTWDLTVNGKFVELDGKYTNYSRGACDPTAGSCPPPRDPGMAPFIVRGNCTTNAANVSTCSEIGLVHATFDATSKTISIPVPLAMVKATKGSKISAGANLFGGTISAIPATFLSSGNAPMDTLQVMKTFVVP
jgi:hypothetical protein